jgi:hypothetical protein
MTTQAEQHIRKRALEVTAQLTGSNVERIANAVEGGDDQALSTDFRAVFDFAMDVHLGAKQFHAEEIAKAQAEIEALSKDRFDLALQYETLTAISAETLRLFQDVKGIVEEHQRCRVVLSMLAEACEREACFAPLPDASPEQHSQRGLGMGALSMAKALLAPVDIDVEDAVDDAVGNALVESAEPG